MPPDEKQRHQPTHKEFGEKYERPKNYERTRNVNVQDTDVRDRYLDELREEAEQKRQAQNDVRSRDVNRRDEYVKKLKEEAKQKYQERADSQRYQISQTTGDKVPATDTRPSGAPGSSSSSLIQPGSTTVERRQAPGTRPTTSSEYLEGQDPQRRRQALSEQRRAEASSTQVEQKKKSGRKLTARKLRSGRKKLRKLKTKGRSTKGLARTLRQLRAYRATWLAVGACTPLYAYQFIWAGVVFAGWGVEAGVISLSSLFWDNFVTRLLDGAVRLAFPGATIGAVAWVIVAVLGMLQVILTFSIYLANLINPIGKAKSFTWFLITLALIFVPIPIPWVALWMWTVIDDVSGDE